MFRERDLRKGEINAALLMMTSTRFSNIMKENQIAQGRAPGFSRGDSQWLKKMKR
jgi:hypothetical protein